MTEQADPTRGPTPSRVPEQETDVPMVFRGGSPANDAADVLDGAMATETVSLYVTQRAHIDPDRAQAAFADLSWLGRPVDAAADAAPGAGWRRVATDLELPVRDGSGPAVRKAALIDVGAIRETDGGLHVPIAWRSASFTPLFPVFAGQLEITRSGLALAGRYAPPFGRVGLLIDQGLLNFVATRTAQAFLTRVARQGRDPSAGGDDR